MLVLNSCKIPNSTYFVNVRYKSAKENLLVLAEPDNWPFNNHYHHHYHRVIIYSGKTTCPFYSIVWRVVLLIRHKHKFSCQQRFLRFAYLPEGISYIVLM